MYVSYTMIKEWRYTGEMPCLKLTGTGPFY